MQESHLRGWSTTRRSGKNSGIPGCIRAGRAGTVKNGNFVPNHQESPESSLSDKTTGSTDSQWRRAGSGPGSGEELTLTNSETGDKADQKTVLRAVFLEESSRMAGITTSVKNRQEWQESPLSSGITRLGLINVGILCFRWLLLSDQQ